jgi:hypothetical protein
MLKKVSVSPVQKAALNVNQRPPVIPASQELLYIRINALILSQLATSVKMANANHAQITVILAQLLTSVQDAQEALSYLTDLV